jgi:hypothetical protein
MLYAEAASSRVIWAGIAWAPWWSVTTVVDGDIWHMSALLAGLWIALPGGTDGWGIVFSVIILFIVLLSQACFLWSIEDRFTGVDLKLYMVGMCWFSVLVLELGIDLSINKSCMSIVLAYWGLIFSANSLNFFNVLGGVLFHDLEPCNIIITDFRLDFCRKSFDPCLIVLFFFYFVWFRYSTIELLECENFVTSQCRKIEWSCGVRKLFFL